MLTYTCLWIISFMGSLVAEILPKDRQYYNKDIKDTLFNVLKDLLSSILPTLITAVLLDMFGEKFPDSVYLLITFILGLLGKELTCYLSNYSSVSEMIKTLYDKFGYHIDDTLESFEEEDDNERTG